MVGQQGQSVAAVALREVGPVEQDVVFDVVPRREAGVLQTAFADVERRVLIEFGGVERHRKVDVELVAAVVEGAAVLVEGVLLGEFADADVVFPVDPQVEVDLAVALAVLGQHRSVIVSVKGCDAMAPRMRMRFSRSLSQRTETSAGVSVEERKRPSS